MTTSSLPGGHNSRVVARFWYFDECFYQIAVSNTNPEQGAFLHQRAQSSYFSLRPLMVFLFRHMGIVMPSSDNPSFLSIFSSTSTSEVISMASS